MPYSESVTLTDDGSFDRPADWNDADNKIECWGAGGTAGLTIAHFGGDPVLGVAGAGGDYASITNVTVPPAVNYSAGQPTQPIAQAPGPGGDTYVSNPNEAVFVLAKGGSSEGVSIGGATYAGGQATSNSAWGGGGAAGPAGPGGQKGSPTTKGGTGNGGGGGVGGVEDANGTDPADGGGGSGRATDAITFIRKGGFPGGGTGVFIEESSEYEFSGSEGGAGEIRISRNPV